MCPNFYLRSSNGDRKLSDICRDYFFFSQMYPSSVSCLDIPVPCRTCSALDTKALQKLMESAGQILLSSSFTDASVSSGRNSSGA